MSRLPFSTVKNASSCEQCYFALWVINHSPDIILVKINISYSHKINVTMRTFITVLIIASASMKVKLNAHLLIIINKILNDGMSIE